MLFYKSQIHHLLEFDAVFLFLDLAQAFLQHETQRGEKPDQKVSKKFVY